LIEHQRIKTTLAKAKAVRPLAEKMVTLGKQGSLHARRTALAVLRQKNAVKKLFDDIAPRSADRNGGYTRIIRLGVRKSDAARLRSSNGWMRRSLSTRRSPRKKARSAKAQSPQRLTRRSPRRSRRRATRSSVPKAERLDPGAGISSALRRSVR